MITRPPVIGDIIRYIPTGFEWEVKYVTQHIAYETPDIRDSKHCFIFKFPNGEYNTHHEIVGEES